MAGGLRGEPGGIRGLCELIDEHAEAIEADLLEWGWRLADVGVRFSWRDLLVMVRRFQALPSTATSRAIHGEHWSVTDQLLAAVTDLLQVGNWQRQNKKSAPKPKPLTRPWEKPKGRRFGANPIPIHKFNDWWDSKAKKKKKRG